MRSIIQTNPPHSPFFKGGYWIVIAAAIVVAAAGVRLRGLAEIDLFCDEAHTTQIASSLWQHGELNNFRYSRFLPGHYFRDGVMRYFPPLSYVIAAPFAALRDRVGPSVAPRLPALLCGLVFLVLLIPTARICLGDAAVGLAAAALSAVNGFHIGMSRMALPYSLLPALLLLALLALLRALRHGRRADWIIAALAIAATAYINQIALLFWPIFACCGLSVRNDRVALRRLVMCLGAALGAFLLWVLVLARGALFANALLQHTAGYSFGAQLTKLGNHYLEMLAPWPLLVLCGIGTLGLAVDIVRRRDAYRGTLVLWLALPAAILLTRSMWILDYHLYAVYPAVILAAAYGTRLATRAAAAAVRANGRHADLVFAAAIALLCWAEWQLAPPVAARAALEFGDTHIVSDATAYIRQHSRGEAIIAPIGMSEAYYLEQFVHSKHGADGVARCLDLLQREPAWVFMGDNFFHFGRLDDCDHYVRQHGRLIRHTAPVEGFTDSANPLGYAVYYLPAPDRRR